MTKKKIAVVLSYRHIIGNSSARNEILYISSTSYNPSKRIIMKP